MIEGYAEHFVGRRRELQRLLPSLREGRIQTVVITGMGGTGKSTLATRLARKLEAEHFTLVTVPSAEGKPLRASNLLQALGDAFVEAKDRAAHDVLVNPTFEVAERLCYAVMALNRGRFVLVLDNFEVNLDEASKLILDAEVARFYTHLLGHLAGGSRCVITSRFLPADVLPLPRTVQQEPLADFPEASFVKFLLSDPQLEQRYVRGELPHELLAEMQRLLGGTPRFLDQVRTFLHTVSKEELAAELRDLDLGGTLDAGELQALRERYLERIVTARLFGYLPLESQAALCRAAVYGVAVSAEALRPSAEHRDPRVAPSPVSGMSRPSRIPTGIGAPASCGRSTVCSGAGSWPPNASEPRSAGPPTGLPAPTSGRWRRRIGRKRSACPGSTASAKRAGSSWRLGSGNQLER
jgi:hypothetical protein